MTTKTLTLLDITRNEVLNRVRALKLSSSSGMHAEDVVHHLKKIKTALEEYIDLLDAGTPVHSAALSAYFFIDFGFDLHDLETLDRVSDIVLKKKVRYDRAARQKIYDTIFNVVGHALQPTPTTD